MPKGEKKGEFMKKFILMIIYIYECFVNTLLLFCYGFVRIISTSKLFSTSVWRWGCFLCKNMRSSCEKVYYYDKQILLSQYERHVKCL